MKLQFIQFAVATGRTEPAEPKGGPERGTDYYNMIYGLTADGNLYARSEHPYLGNRWCALDMEYTPKTEKGVTV